MFRARKPCRFFQEGRCHYGNNCHFSHEAIPPPPARPPPFTGFATTSNSTTGGSMPRNSYLSAASTTTARNYNRSSISPPPAPIVHGSGNPEASARLAEAFNSMRVAAGKQPLEPNSKFLEILEVAACRMDGEDFDSASEALRDSFRFDYDSYHGSEQGSNYDSEEDEEFGEMDLFSPLKKTTPEYPEPVFSARQTAHYERNSYSVVNDVRRESFFDWDLLDNPSVLNATFGVNFSIEDTHIAGFAARPDICRRLQRFTAGDSGTGVGGGVRSEAAFIQFVRLCASMRVFRLEAFNSLTDATLVAIFEACPRIEMVQLTGHDKSPGHVIGTALMQLARMPSWAPNLKALLLLDQHGLDASVKALSKARPTLWIHTGESGDDDASAYKWLGGKIVSVW